MLTAVIYYNELAHILFKIWYRAWKRGREEEIRRRRRGREMKEEEGGKGEGEGKGEEESGSREVDKFSNEVVRFRRNSYI